LDVVDARCQGSSCHNMPVSNSIGASCNACMCCAAVRKVVRFARRAVLCCAAVRQLYVAA
jgi:hypothetical protein